MFKQTKILGLTILASVFSFTLSSAKAATVEFNARGNITGIKDLVVNNSSYNVNFVQDTFSNLFGNPSNLNLQPTFWLNAQGAEAARNAIDNVLTTTYPALIALGETQNTGNYVIPQQSAFLGFWVIDSQGNFTYPSDLFGAVLGNYGSYYAGRKWQEDLEQMYQNGGMCSCQVMVISNPDIYGIAIDATRTFALFSPNQAPVSVTTAATIPEPDSLMGVIAIGLSIFFFFPQKFNLPKHHKV
ncbi:MAG: hypothetical protein ACKPGT_33435 [Microcystis sp.]